MKKLETIERVKKYTDCSLVNTNIISGFFCIYKNSKRNSKQKH